MKNLSYLLLLLLAQSCCAEYCKELKIGELIPEFRADVVKDLHDCRIMPNSPGKAIIAYLTPDEGVSFPDSASDYNLEIFIVETKTNNIIKHLHDGKLSFAVYDPVEINIDVAKYSLNKIQRAFGVRIKTHLFSRLANENVQWLNLYVENQSALANILKGFSVHHERGSYDDSCEYGGETENKTLSMLVGENEGFANIEVTSEVKTLSSKMEGNECKQQPSKITTSKSTLKYLDGAYK